jgi:peptidoglycan/xylan/chitin deacetylase (PgdA/CDA1 family)
VDRLIRPGRRRFAAFTLDDGYRDNLLHAYPVFSAENVPFTIYIPSEWPETKGAPWWCAIEEVVANCRSVEPGIKGLPVILQTGTVEEKFRTFRAMEQRLLHLDEVARRAWARDLARRYGVEATCRNELMNWEEIRELVRDKLVTIGAHSKTHAILAKLNDADMCDEIVGSRARIEAELGRPCRHFAYPYGSADFAGPREFAATIEAGFATAVTARRGLLYPGHRNRLAVLPRIPLEGHMQDEGLIEVQLSGAPFALRDGLRRRMA